MARRWGRIWRGARRESHDVIRGARSSSDGQAAGRRFSIGSLAPDGAVIKTAAADPRLWQHTGPAVVFNDYQRHGGAHQPAKTWTSTRIRFWCCKTPVRWAVRECPNGACCRSPRSCCKRGVRDMVRISDARMSGTSYGTCVLHVSPESYVGGPLALVRGRGPDHAGYSESQAGSGECRKRDRPAAVAMDASGAEGRIADIWRFIVSG